MALTSPPHEPDQEVVFFTICTRDFFLGLVALINSLRRLGHGERIVVLDCGLSDHQLALLKGHCETVKPPADSATSAAMYKAFGHAMNPRGVSIIIDSDMIVTRRLDAAIAEAREGKICACNDPEVERWFAEWSEIFVLEKPLRREEYINTGFVIISNAQWPDLLPRWWKLCERIFSRRVLYHGDHSTDPTAQADQDVLNAMLMSEISAGSVSRLPETTVSHCTFQQAKLIDEETLACTRKGEPTFVLHWPGRPKPWEWRGARAWRGWTTFSNSNPYIVLLRRLLTRDDVAIKVPVTMLPRRLAPGPTGAAAFTVQGAFGQHVFGPARHASRKALGRA